MASRFKIRLDNNLQQIEYLREQLTAFSEKFGLTDDALFKLTLCLDELFVNSVSYGFASPGHSEFMIYLELGQNLLCAEIIDDGTPFDPFKDAPLPDLQAPVEERALGGLGIHLVKSLSHSTEYRFHENRNHVYLTMQVQ
ncbi:MAG: ATP-binding protein [Gammaproteobacteria bacterium]|nr:ATP-binding protein [Gammaproteobacteria bacterium]